ncbi:divalent-cation tolerance protein CutA [Malaciobacter halophilus]|uniref:Divalent-cation tolerance protein CutA n=1 Tax=Malaciobacter halophilus TaxID=197482 RepID=A0A2N1J1P0_9BACT|nr:divalent-cation tolerance protein CutA [Malaciobacter halophilus]AXH08635.1 putative CutA divalent ion tolerance protein [Malaciobacter halophilus]PKI80480.1 divalent-cation tolerance protein CutA [Malaciobacter halophilus]
MKPILVQTTTNSIKEAKKISKILLEKKLAACIQVSKIDSFYVWKDDFCEDEEFLISIKTKKENFEKIERKIKELHSYDVPEIISFKIDSLSKEYKSFLSQNC